MFPPKRDNGFTLVEMTIVMLILAVLVTLALPMYTDMVRESRRQDATTALLSIEQEQELHRTNNPTYGGLGDVWGSAATNEGHYTLNVSNVSATGYTVTATAVGDQGSDNEDGTMCNPMQIEVTAVATNRTPVECW